MPFSSVVIAVLLAGSALGSHLLSRQGRAAAAVRLARSGLAAGLAVVAAVVVARFVGAADPGGVAHGRIGDLVGTVVAGFVLLMATTVAAYADRALAASRTAPRLFVAINLLAAATVAVSTAELVAVQVLAWVGVSVATAALIAADGRPGSRSAGRTANRVLAVGDVALVAAVGVAAAGTGSLGRVDDLAAAVGERGGAVAAVVGLAVVVAAAARSGLVPLHRWLIGSVEAPTPVSAVLHAGVVNGSAVLLIRWFPAYRASVMVVTALIVTGLVSMLLGVAAARTRPDVKGGLAWTTTAQMGFMVVQCALGLFGPAIVHLAAHGLFKSSLFLGAASQADHGMGAHPAPRRPRAVVAAAGALAAAATVAVPLLVVRPAFLDHPAAVLPVVVMWAMVTTALVRVWDATPRPTVATVVGRPVALAAGLTVTVAASDLVDGATGLPHTIAPAGAAAWAVVVPAIVALVALGGPLVARRRPALAAAVWTWCSDPTIGGRPLWAAWRAERRVPAALRPGPSPIAADAEAARTARMTATVADAAAVLAPSFPLERFVAVNPLLGLEDQPAAAAVWTAVDELGVRAELDEDTYRAQHRDGRISTADLRAAAADHLAAQGEPSAPAAVDALVEELLYDAPVRLGSPRPVLMAERYDAAVGSDRAAFVDEVAARWVSRYLSTHVAWEPPGRAEGLWAMWRAGAGADLRVVGRAGAPYRALLAALPSSPTAALAKLLVELGVDRPDHRSYLRRHLVRHHGWASALIRRSGAEGEDLVAYLAIRLTVEAALMAPAADRVLARTADVRTPAATDPRRAARLEVWRTAYERGYRDHLLTQLSTATPAADRAAADPAASGSGAAVPAHAVGVFCIDARSEGLRRAFEGRGRYETVGYAGFFGLPVAVADHHHAPVPSCPVIVEPTATFAEVERGGDGRHDRAEAAEAAVVEAFTVTKRSFLGPYATAENAGWVLGARSVARTLAPAATARATRAVRRRWQPPVDTEMRIVGTPWTAEERLAVAESIVRTAGLADTAAPVVILCGHESRNTNNLHRAALDCGACGGRSGANNARTAAALLNDPDVRRGLAAIGVPLPAGTVVVAAVHETTTDTVRLLDGDLVPASHRTVVDAAVADLAAAGRVLAAERAVDLPRSVGVVGTTPDAVATRSVDWAQVVPEWGLAGNAALVVGPRSLTAAHDLDRRAFLHHYDADADADGAVLGAIVGGPLLVAHWISSQYRASAVDPERLGAGTKPAHNLVGGVGVLEGGGGDLRLGLPAESVGTVDRPVHEPMRLLVVIDAPVSRIDAAVAGNETVRRVADHQWIQLVGRAEGGDGDGWMVRRGPGSWQVWTPGVPAVDEPLVDAG